MKLGVIGGLGPLASSYLYELLTAMNDVECDQDHLEIIIHSCPSIPDRTAYILDHSKENPLPRLIEIAKELEDLGVDYIAIPCITADYFYEDLVKDLHVPVIHLVKETAQYLLRHKIKTVGIMATKGTIETKILQRELENNNIQCVIPDALDQRDVMTIIYDNIKKGKPIDIERFHRVSDHLFNQGADKIILGCTELSIVKKEYHLDDRYLDTNELLAALSLKKCQMKVKKKYHYLID